MSEEHKAVFLSYASQDADAVERIAEALHAVGIEAWFDQSELRGGDAWDANIRQQIQSCALFMPVISANTQSRPEGYFRLEWKLAVDRSHLMSDDHPFFLPVVIDDTADSVARVPARFRERQWTRLPAGETPPAFCERVKKLLEGKVAPVSDRRIDEAETANAGQRPAPPRRRIRNRFLATAVSIAVVVGLLAFWAPWRQKEQLSPAVVAPGAASLTAAQELNHKARAILAEYDSSHADYLVAEGYIKRALELDPSDGEVWATSSILNTAFRTRGFDLSRTRDATARSHAERALTLAPESVEALFALGRWQRDNDPDDTIAEKTFLQVIARQPGHSEALQNLGNIYDRQDRVDEAVAMLRRAARESANPALATYREFLLFFRRARFAEANTAIRASIATQPSANSQAGLAMLLLTWKGDADGAAEAVTSGPASTRNEPRTIWVSATAHLARRAPEDALRVMARFSDDYIQDNWCNAPAAYFSGLSHALARRPDAARVAWEAGIGVVDIRLKTQPDNRDLHLVRGELLALLGRVDDALHEVRVVDQLGRGRFQTWYNSSVRIHALLGRADDVLPMLREQLQMTREQRNLGWPLTPALLRVDPMWDKLRGDHQFRRLLADAAESEQSGRNWPKDPELRRAMDLVNSYEAITEDYALAEDVALAKVEAKPSDPEAVTVMARVQSQILLRGFDRSDERYAKTKRFAERAQQLAPDEPEALYALAICLDLRGGAQDRVKSLLTRAMTLAPTEPSYARLEARVYFNERPEEGVKRTEHVAAQFPNDVLAQYDLARIYRDEGRIADMEAALDRTIAIYPLTNAIVWKARTRLWVHGDPAGMKVLLDSVPVRSRGIERVAISRYIYAMVSGEIEDGLESLRSLPNAWIEDFDFIGPKHMLQGELLLRGGKPELARLEFEAALDEVLRQKARAPTAVAPRSAEVWILHRLGRSTEARAGLALVLDAVQRPYRLSLYSQWMFQTPVLLLLMGERAQALSLLKEVAEQPVGRVLIGSALKFDPLMAPWRDDPEIRGLLIEPAKRSDTK